MTNDIDFAEIRKWLEFGDIATLAKTHSLSSSQGSAHLSGRKKKYNVKYISACIERAADNKRKLLLKQNSLMEIK